MVRTQLTEAREEVWCLAIQRGMSTAEIARICQVSVQYVRRLIARASPPESPSSDLTEIPTLVLCDHPRPSSAVCYHLGTDRISLDGGPWLDHTETPSMPVLAPIGDGREYRIRRMQAGTRTEPGGPTSLKPDPCGLKGGRR